MCLSDLIISRSSSGILRDIETTHASASRLPRPFPRPTPHNKCQVHIIILFIYSSSRDFLDVTLA
jgi:hypothetical protein